MSTTRKLIIAHDLLGNISDSEIQEALGVDPQAENWPIIRFPESHRLELGKTINLGWMRLKVYQEDFYYAEIAPALPNKEALNGGDFELIYFGLAPVPLAIHLGFLISPFIKVRVFQRHHSMPVWKWSGFETPLPVIPRVLSSPYDGPGDVVLRIGTSYSVTEDQTKQIVKQPVTSIDIKAPAENPELFGTEEGINKYASKIQELIHQITTYLPNADAIHIFAAVPVGLAFLIGHRINPNPTKPIYTYEFSSSRAPQYKLAFSLQSKPRIRREMTESDMDHIQFRRNFFENHLKKTKHFSTDLGKQPENENWFRYLFATTEVGSNLFDSVIWNELIPICKTDFESSHFVYVPHNVPNDDGMSMTLSKNTWYLPDNFLYSLESSFEGKEQGMIMALELLWFQEIVKSETHDVHADNADELAFYPAILQEIDYQADVYALLHLYGKYKMNSKNAFAFFIHAIDIHLKTMWSTDTLDHSDEMELRRVNRYLIWYYHLCMIKEQSMPLEQILQLLSKKPIIELRLVSVTTPDQRKITIEFKQSDESELAIAAFHNNRIITSRQQLPMRQLIDGFKNRDSSALMEVIHQFVRDLK